MHLVLLRDVWLDTCYVRILRQYILWYTVVVQELAIGLIKWLIPKGLKVFSYVEKYAEFKNETLKKYRQVNKSVICNGIPPG